MHSTFNSVSYFDYSLLLHTCGEFFVGHCSVNWIEGKRIMYFKVGYLLILIDCIKIQKKKKRKERWKKERKNSI